MLEKNMGENATAHGFTLIEILVALLISSILATAIYSFFITQHHAYTVQDQVVEMEQNARAATDMIRRELRMAGYNAMGDEFINSLSDFVPSTFIPTVPVTVNLDANPKISEGSGTDPDMITFLSVVSTNNNPTVLSAAASAGDTLITLDLNNTETDEQYNAGDMLHIGTSSEYAKVITISGNTLTIDTNPGVSGNQGLAQNYAAGISIGEISVVSYAVFNDDNDPSYDRHDPGHPELKRKINGAGFMPVAENITDMQLVHLGSGEVQMTLSSRTDRSDYKFQTNSGYRTYTSSARVKVRNADTVAVGTTCDIPSAPSNLVLDGLNDTYPCKIQTDWDAVTEPPGCDVTGYKIYYGTTSGSYAYSVDVGNVTTYVLDVTALKDCTYNVAVTAVNSAGTSPKSDEEIITDAQAPAMPTGFDAENINGVERKVSLSWDMNTECDLQGYNAFGRSDSVAAPAPQINTNIIPKAMMNYTDTNFTPIDCATYYYSMEAVDYCPNASVSTTEVSVSPTAPEPPTDPVFSTTGLIDTISWNLSSDDFEVSAMNYIDEYRVYDPAGILLATLDSGIDTWTSAAANTYYDVSAKDACGNESEKLRITSSCTEVPVIVIDSPADGASVSGTITITGTATVPEGRTIDSIQLKIDNETWIGIADTTPWSVDWDTTQVTDGDHTITVRATDNEGCYGEQSITVNVSNESSVTPQVFCTLFTCKDPGNNPINLVVYVYDHEDEPVTGATVEANIKFGSGSGSNEIPPTDIEGYYGGEDAAACTLYSNDPEASIPTGDLAIKSKSKYKDGTKTTIIIDVTKQGFVGSTCTIDAE